VSALTAKYKENVMDDDELLVEYECPQCGSNMWDLVVDTAICIDCGYVLEGVLPDED
jgi:predicted RNA-binding Zn-ribbon protein involved in translation (DUF1610 family)